MNPHEKFESAVTIIDPQTAADEYRLLYPVGSYDIEHVTPERMTGNKINPGAFLISKDGDNKWFPKSIVAADNEMNLYILNELYDSYR